MAIESIEPTSGLLQEFADFFTADDIVYNGPSTSCDKKQEAAVDSNNNSSGNISSSNGRSSTSVLVDEFTANRNQDKVDNYNISYDFELESFEWCREVFIESPPLKNCDDDKQQWRLVVYPRGENDTYGDFVSVYVKSDRGEDFTAASFEISILNEANERVHETRSHLAWVFNQEESIGFPKFISREQLFNDDNGYLAQGVLKLHCEIKCARKCPSASISR